MNKEETTKKEELVERRRSVDNSIINELRQRYPKFSKKGIAYDLGLTYINIEIDYLKDASIRKAIKKYGAEVFGIIIFFRLKMCKPNGWFCEINDEQLEFLIEDCAFALKMDEARIEEILNYLIENKVFYVISDEEGKYLTDIQQIYNFEILNAHRVYDRNRKNKGKPQNTNEQGVSNPATNDVANASAPSSNEATLDDEFDFDPKDDDFGLWG